jgi:hypothetical protein
MICIINDVMCSLLSQTFPYLARYWADNLHAVTYLLNLPPMIQLPHPLCPARHHSLLRPPLFHRLCLLPEYFCHHSHKLTLRSCWCVFLGYSKHKGYRVSIFARIVYWSPDMLSSTCHPSDSLFTVSSTVPSITPPCPSSVVGTSETLVAPRATLTSRLFQLPPPWCANGGIRLCVRALVLGRRSTTPSSWFVTPVAPT